MVYERQKREEGVTDFTSMRRGKRGGTFTKRARKG